MTDPADNRPANFIEPERAHPLYQAPPEHSSPLGHPGDSSAPAEKERQSTSKPGRGRLSMPALILIIAVAALFIIAVLLVLFNSSSDSVNALSVVAIAIVSITASYLGLSIATRQLAEERTEKAAALARASEAESSVRESDAWAGQMEAGLRVAMVKLQAAGIPSADVVKAAGAPDDFF